MRRLRIIISIDGGGIRGILPLMILSEINQLVVRKRLCRNLNECIDLSAGTSTGAIISAAMMLKNNNKYQFLPENILNLYVARGPQIFTPSTKATDDKRDFAFKLILENTFGHMSLKDLSNRFAFVSFDENKNEPFVFSNLKENLRDVSLAKALLACSAIPEYFRPVELGSFLLSDGIKTAKNPSKIALDHARAFFPDDAFLLISLGTGNLRGELQDEIEKSVLDVHKSLEKEAESSKDLIYFRFQPDMPNANHDMDDASPENIEKLILDGERYIKANTAKFKKLIKQWENYNQ
jgi:patatin-like phospholipase/acyl hydrolase